MSERARVKTKSYIKIIIYTIPECVWNRIQVNLRVNNSNIIQQRTTKHETEEGQTNQKIKSNVKHTSMRIESDEKSH